MNLWSTFLELDSLYENNNKKLYEWKLMPTNQQKQATSQPTTTSQAPIAKLHKASALVIDNYTDNLSYHISELEDEGDIDAEDSIEYFENYPDIVAIVQAGSDIIFKLSDKPEDEDVVYWILTYALGEVGNDIAENGRYKANRIEIIVSDIDFNAALNNNLK